MYVDILNMYNYLNCSTKDQKYGTNVGSVIPAWIRRYVLVLADRAEAHIRTYFQSQAQ